MINITNKRLKDRYQREAIRQMIILEKRGAKEIRPILNRQYMDAAKFVKKGIYNVNAPVNAHGERLYNILYNHYRRCAVVFARRAFNKVNKEKSITPPFLKKKEDEDRKKYWLVLFAFIRRNAVEKAEEMDGTTISIIQRLINKGLGKGLSDKEIAKNLVNAGIIANPKRALRAAKTETHSISVFATDEAIVGTGLVQEREWMTARDERVRTYPFSHVAADGERVGPKDKFIRTGEPLDYPGDPKASPGNRINCRCLILYFTMKKLFNNYNRKRFAQAA